MRARRMPGVGSTTILQAGSYHRHIAMGPFARRPCFAERPRSSWMAFSMSHSLLRIAGCILAVLLANGAVVIVAIRFGYGTTIAVHATAYASSLLVLLCAIGESSRILVTRGGRGNGADRAGIAAWLCLTAVFFAALAATVLTVRLGIRLTYVALDTVNVRPSEGLQAFGFHAGGLWCLGLLFVGASLFHSVTRDRQLMTCLYLIATAAAVWASLLLPVYLRTPNGGLESGGATHALQATMALLVGGVGAVALTGRRRSATGSDSAASDARSAPPGLRIVCGVQALFVLILVCYHAAVPLPLAYGGIFASAVIGTISGLCGSFGCIILSRSLWSLYFVDVALGLLAMAWACAVMTVVPHWPLSMVERYPVAMNAQMIGLAIAVGVFTWLVGLGQRRHREGLTTSWFFRASGAARRFAFLSGALALTLGGLMAAWPRLRFVAVPDDSIGRVTAGFGAYLFLFLMMLVSSRRLKRLTFHILTLLVLASAVGFMMIRMYPYTAKFE